MALHLVADVVNRGAFVRVLSASSLVVMMLVGCGAGDLPGPADVALPAGDVDPGSRELTCTGDVASASIDYEAGAVGTSTDPVSVVEGWAAGLQEGDVLTAREASGPTGETTQEVLVRRGDRVVAVVHLAAASDGTFLVGGYDACDADGIRWP